MSSNDKREEIVRAALELIAENGFHGAPMAMIAERARVGAGTIYRYFENKDLLIAGLYRGPGREDGPCHAGRLLLGAVAPGAVSPPGDVVHQIFHR